MKEKSYSRKKKSICKQDFQHAVFVRNLSSVWVGEGGAKYCQKYSCTYSSFVIPEAGAKRYNREMLLRYLLFLLLL